MADVSLGQSGHMLALKVMRLSRPKFYPLHGLPVDPYDEWSPCIENALSKKSGEDSITTPVGEYLIAPQQFEAIYLGETFTFFVNCVNESKEEVSDVVIKVDLQTNSQKINLPCDVDGVGLKPEESKGQLLSHEVKESGQHILVCAVSYKTSTLQAQYFRKFFKFPVTKPVDVRTKFYNAEDSLSNDVFLEAQIENTCACPMILERVDLQPSEHYTSQPVLPKRDSEWSSVLRPKDVRQFLFCLTPTQTPGTTYKEVTNIGKLDMEWRTSMGERGRLQTSALIRIPPRYGDVRVTVERVPATTKVRNVFLLTCKLHNLSDRSLDLRLLWDSSIQPTLVLCSTSNVSIGQIPPGGQYEFSLEILPASSGLHNISGLRAYDSFSKRTFEFDDLSQILVV